jgi:hypothetical protein
MPLTAAKTRAKRPGGSNLPGRHQTRQDSKALCAIEPLPRIVRTNKRDYTLVKRTGNIAIYQSGDIIEVIRIRIAKPATLPSGTILPWRETYPSSEQFGSHGFVYTPASHRDPLAAAKEKMKELSA